MGSPWRLEKGWKTAGWDASDNLKLDHSTFIFPHHLLCKQRDKCHAAVALFVLFSLLLYADSKERDLDKLTWLSPLGRMKKEHGGFPQFWNWTMSRPYPGEKREKKTTTRFLGSISSYVSMHTRVAWNTDTVTEPHWLSNIKFWHFLDSWQFLSESHQFITDPAFLIECQHFFQRIYSF